MEDTHPLQKLGEHRKANLGEIGRDMRRDHDIGKSPDCLGDLWLELMHIQGSSPEAP